MASRRVSYEQLETLWEFLNTHRDIAMGYNKSAQAREMSRRMWTEVAGNLNSVVGGAYKNWKTWSAYWVDYKGKLKRKCATIRASQSRTGGGPCEIPVLTEIEKKYLSILGEDYGAGLPGIQVNPFHTESTQASTSTASQDHSPSILLMHEEVLGENINDEVSQQVFIIPDPEDLVYQPPTTQPIQPAEPMTSTQSRYQPSTTQPIQPAEPMMSTQSRSQPSTTQPIQPEPMMSTQSRRRRRRSAPMSEEMTRRALVESGRLRAEATQGICTVLNNIENALSRIAATLDSINNRLLDGVPTNEL